MCRSLEIEDLSWKYLRMYPVRDLVWENFKKNLIPMDYEDSQVFQRQLFQSTINHPIAQKYPPAKTYMQLFLKTLINQVEGCNQEVHDDLYSSYTRVLSQGNTQNNEFCYKTYKQKSGSITLKETCKLICNGTTGTYAWEAGHFLAEWCSKNANLFRCKNIIELGSGLGLTGLAVVKNCFPSVYTFTDVNESVLKVLVENININVPGKGISLNESEEKERSFCFVPGMHDPLIQVKKLDWECDSYKSEVPVEIILAADVVYDPDVTTHLMRILKDIMCRDSRITAYIASTLRNPDTYNFFRNELASKGFVVISEVQEQYQDTPSQSQVSISLLHIKHERSLDRCVGEEN